MKKKLIIYIMSVTIIALFIYSTFIFGFNNDPKNPEGQLQVAFDASGVHFASSEIYAWGIVESNSSTNFNEIKSMVESISDYLGVVGTKITINENSDDGKALSDFQNWSKNKTSSDRIKEVQVNGTLEDSAIINIKGRTEIKEKISPFSSISVDIVINEPGEEFKLLRDKLEQAFNRYNIEAEINSCITGYFNGKVSNDYLNEAFQRSFIKIGAQKVDAIRDFNLISITAYCPYIKDYIRVKGSKANINLAIRYNSYEDKTYIWLATPIITTEYWYDKMEVTIWQGLSWKKQGQ